MSYGEELKMEITCKLAKYYKFNSKYPKDDFVCDECRFKAKMEAKKIIRSQRN